MKQKKALFLDRDGIINNDVGYVYKISDVVFVEGIFDICRIAQEKGYLLIVVTNQSGVAKGWYTESDVKILHDWMRTQFELQNVSIQQFYYSPYHPEALVEEYRRDSMCRKPGIGMYAQAAHDFDIDLSRSIMIGDKNSDRIPFAGLRSYIVKSVYCPIEYDLETIHDLLPHL